jgi:hypothetical protein
MRKLYEEARFRAEPVYCHGDLSRSNILAHQKGIGLIDFQWRIMLRGYDLVRFSHRTQHEGLTMRSWSASLVAALLKGYGEQDFASSPNWRFYSVRYLVRQSARPLNLFSARRWSTKRARRTLRLVLCTSDA